MSKKSEFIDFVNDLIEASKGAVEPSNDAWAYWIALCGGNDGEKPTFTDNGKLIMKFLQDHQDTPMWKARDIAEGLFISSRAVSGAMRKLVTDGFVEKVGQDPVIYSITENGKNITIE